MRGGLPKGGVVTREELRKLATECIEDAEKSYCIVHPHSGYSGYYDNHQSGIVAHLAAAMFTLRVAEIQDSKKHPDGPETR